MNHIIAKPQGFKIHLVSAALATLLLAGCAADEGLTTIVPGPAIPNAALPAIGQLEAMPSSVPTGGMTTIVYQATDATNCRAVGQWAGASGISTVGSQAVTVPMEPGVYTYGLTCTNATGQETTRFVSVTVTGPAVVGPGTITPGTLLPNDGTTPTTVFEDGLTGVQLPGNFICTASARAYGNNPVTAIRVNGLVGSMITDLLNTLGAGTVTQLQNSVNAKELVVDGSLDTFAQYNLSVGLLGGAISSIDLYAGLNAPAPVGKFAVFGVTFPIATAELSLLQSITVSTFLGDTPTGETRVISADTLDLVGQVATGDTTRYVGFKVTRPYDGVTISLNPMLISANIGNAMNVHELCTDGRFVNAP